MGKSEMTDEPEFVYLTSNGYRVPGTLESLLQFAVALFLATSDMHQVVAACDMLEEEPEDTHRARALETAVPVCDARAFTQSTLQRLPRDEFAPPKGTDERALHDVLMGLRNKVYAHTDVESGRSVSDLTIKTMGDITRVEHAETWHPLDRDLPIREVVPCAGGAPSS